MYKIINKTTGVTEIHKGDFPNEYLEKLLFEEQRIIVISYYSRTIKVPYVKIESCQVTWDWEDFPFPT